MPNATATQVKKSNNPFDIFITGLRKGFNVAINNLMPNVLMAFVLAYILDLFGVMSFLGKVCGPVMSIFDLPGQAITVLCATWLSCGAGKRDDMISNWYLRKAHQTACQRHTQCT